MPHTTKCTQCGIQLNIPEGAAGRRLKCPKCGTRFLPDAPNPNAASSSMRPGIPDASLDSKYEVSPLRSRPDPPASSGDPRKGGHGQADMPTASGDLRDTFDLPLLVDDEPAAPRSRQVGDAAALFQEKPGATRRQSAAEARARARRCPTCGGVVPAGMSLCNSCGLNLETGLRIDLDEDLAPAPLIRSAGTPLGVSIIGGLVFLGSVILTLVSLIQASRAEEGTGFLLLTLVFGFGIYA
jgi:predicted  nucleic acid-binding Zn-ribbon protein